MPHTSFSTEELTDMRTTNTGLQLDSGCIQARVGATKDSFGQVVDTWPSDGATISIGLNMRPGSSRRSPNQLITEYDAEARLPITTIPAVGDRLKITHRFGEAISPNLIFDIVAPIQRGPSGIRVQLKRVLT